MSPKYILFVTLLFFGSLSLLIWNNVEPKSFSFFKIKCQALLDSTSSCGINCTHNVYTLTSNTLNGYYECNNCNVPFDTFCEIVTKYPHLIYVGSNIIKPTNVVINVITIILITMSLFCSVCLLCFSIQYDIQRLTI
jgi:hypothetical protein